MKLIGSKMESDFREELVASHEHHFSTKSRLKEVLESNGHSTKNAYVLRWTRGQTEDFYTVLINGEYLVATELDRSALSAIPSVDRSELENYIEGLSLMHQVKLAVAKELASAEK